MKKLIILEIGRISLLKALMQILLTDNTAKFSENCCLILKSFFKKRTGQHCTYQVKNEEIKLKSSRNDFFRVFLLDLE